MKSDIKALESKVFNDFPLDLDTPFLPFHGGNTGSNPVRDAKLHKHLELSKLCNKLLLISDETKRGNQKKHYP